MDIYNLPHHAFHTSCEKKIHKVIM